MIEQEHFKVGVRPEGIESKLNHPRAKWNVVIQRCKQIKAPECVYVPVHGVTEQRLKNICAGLRISAKRQGVNNGHLKIAHENDYLYVWID